MVLNVLDQWEGQQAALHTLLLDNHEEPARREALVERAVQVLASLLRAKVVEPDDGSALEDWLPADTPGCRRAPPPTSVTPTLPPVTTRATRTAIPDAGQRAGPRPDRRAARRRRARLRTPVPRPPQGEAPPASRRRGTTGRRGAGALRARRRRPLPRGPLPGGARPRRRLRAQPAAVGLRAGGARDARPRGARLRARRRQRHRGHPRRPAPGADGPAVRGTRRGRRRDEGRRPGVRGADGGPRRRHLAAPAGRGARGGPARLPADATRGSTRAGCRRSRWCARCTSGR